MGSCEANHPHPRANRDDAYDNDIGSMERSHKEAARIAKEVSQRNATSWTHSRIFINEHACAVCCTSFYNCACVTYQSVIVYLFWHWALSVLLSSSSVLSGAAVWRTLEIYREAYWLQCPDPLSYDGKRWAFTVDFYVKTTWLPALSQANQCHLCVIQCTLLMSCRGD